jgi:CelD/BcsL family acetyltransferase involved in cellulose biosynthesis
MHTMTFEVVRDIDSFCAMQPEWDDLWSRAGGEYFQSYAYCHGSLIAEAARRRQLHCITARREGRLVALWPLVTSWRNCWKYATPLTPPNRSPSDILVAPDCDVHQVAMGAWRVARKSTQADVFEFWRINSSSPLQRCLTRDAVTRRATEERTPYAPLRGQHDWEAYCRSRPGRSKTRPNYLKRRLAAHGEFNVEMLDSNDPRIPSLVEWSALRKREWAQHNGIDSPWVYSESSSRFWNGLLTNAAYQHGVFHLFVLTLQGKPLAANVVAVGATRAYLLTTTYDLKHANLSPGTVLVDECVKWAFDRGLDFDFGPGEQQYKSSWSGGNSYATSSCLVFPTWWGRAGYFAKHGIRHMRAIFAQITGRQTPAQGPVNAPST